MCDDSDPAVDQELLAIEKAIKDQELSRDDSASWAQLFKGSDRRRSIIVVITTILWSLSGIAFISGYVIILFRQVGLAQPFFGVRDLVCVYHSGDHDIHGSYRRGRSTIHPNCRRYRLLWFALRFRYHWYRN